MRLKQAALGELVAIVASGHPLARREHTDLQRLAEEPFVGFPSGSAARRQRDTAFEAAGLTTEAPFEVTDVASLAKLVRAGLGVGMVPRAVAAELADVHILRVRDAPVCEELLVWSTARPRPPRHFWPGSAWTRRRGDRAPVRDDFRLIRPEARGNDNCTAMLYTCYGPGMTPPSPSRSSRTPRPEQLHEAAEDLQTAMSLLIRQMRQNFSGELTPSQVAMGKRLEWDGPCSVAQLARAEKVRHQSMLATVNAAEAIGVVERRPHPTDGRQVLVALTDRGRTLLRERWQSGTDYLVQLMTDQLTPDEQRTVTKAAALLRQLGEH
ncbi:hypothetical protein GCM10010357_19170 [Streptomyces luteireticuli]|uniref:HTH marR-type domain-containing protein n=1 Tax=Streptomyces luteireticuli TaxID=173858 RepID=A0ABP3ID14_9ACTN